MGKHRFWDKNPVLTYSHAIFSINKTYRSAKSSEAPFNMGKKKKTRIKSEIKKTHLKFWDKKTVSKTNKTQYTRTHAFCVIMENLKVKELKVIAKEHVVKGYYRMRKAELIEALQYTNITRSNHRSAKCVRPFQNKLRY